MASKLSDVKIILDVQKPVAEVNLGELAIFMPASATGYKSYTDLETLEDEITDKEVLAVAKGFFAQDEHCKNLDVVSYSDAAAAIDQYFDAGWEFATIAGTKPTATTPTEPADSGSGDDGDGTATTPAPTPAPTSAADDGLTISNYIEGKGQRFYVEGLAGTKETVDSAADLSKKYEGNEHTILFAAGADAEDSAYAVGALIGAIANQTVGSVTWKFKTLTGVDTCDFTAAQVNTLHTAGIFTYVNKAGIDQTSEGITVTGEYIDALHGDDWVKDTMQAKLQNLLSTEKKISYDVAGIAQISAVAQSVLMTATTNGIVLVNPDTAAGEFTVTTTSRAETPLADIIARAYNGLSFTYERSGAIHSVTVHGTVTM